MLFNLFKKRPNSCRFMSAEKAKELYKAKTEGEEAFKERQRHHKASLEDVILNAIENKESSCFYEVIGHKNYENIKRAASLKGYRVKDAGFSRNIELKDDPNGTFTLKVEW